MKRNTYLLQSNSVLRAHFTAAVTNHSEYPDTRSQPLTTCSQHAHIVTIAILCGNPVGWRGDKDRTLMLFNHCYFPLLKGDERIAIASITLLWEKFDELITGCIQSDYSWNRVSLVFIGIVGWFSGSDLTMNGFGYKQTILTGWTNVSSGFRVWLRVFAWKWISTQAKGEQCYVSCSYFTLQI